MVYNIGGNGSGRFKDAGMHMPFDMIDNIEAFGRIYFIPAFGDDHAPVPDDCFEKQPGAYQIGFVCLCFHNNNELKNPGAVGYTGTKSIVDDNPSVAELSHRFFMKSLQRFIGIQFDAYYAFALIGAGI